MYVSTSAYYAWSGNKGPVISQEVARMELKMKALFEESRGSLGSRQMMKQLRREGFKIGRYRVRKLMKVLGLVVKRKKRHVVTTDSNHSFTVSENHLNRDFSPLTKDTVWATDITYIPTREGWVYLAVVMDLYSRRIVGWHLEQTMQTRLVVRALTMAINLRAPQSGLLHHSDRGSQYASAQYQALLQKQGMSCSMSRKGNCWDNSPMERFFGSLKREWITGFCYETEQSAFTDVSQYIQYYNARRLHTTLGDKTPIEFENGL